MSVFWNGRFFVEDENVSWTLSDKTVCKIGKPSPAVGRLDNYVVSTYDGLVIIAFEISYPMNHHAFPR